MVTPALFERYPDARALARGRRPTSSSRRSTRPASSAPSRKSLVGMAQALVEQHGGEVPADMDALDDAARRRPQDRQRRARPRAGRPGLPVDRHVLRVAESHRHRRIATIRRWSSSSCAARCRPSALDARLGHADPARPPHLQAEAALRSVRGAGRRATTSTRRRAQARRERAGARRRARPRRNRP